MPDLGAILQKAREGAFSTGAAGATGAGSESPFSINGRKAPKPGPGGIDAPGPPGPHQSVGPGGPSRENQPGPALIRTQIEVEQRLSEGGPGGPGGPSEKQPVCDNFEVAPARRSLWCAPNATAPKAWRDGLDLLDCWAPPCPGFRSGEWDDLHRVVAHFMDHHAAEAEACGWTTLDLFGVHEAAGAAAVDSCGALMLPSRRTVTFVSVDAIALGPTVYRRRPLPHAVPVWAFSNAKHSGATP